MTLKELRIYKGLNQAECAKFLGMSTRNYQNYENSPEKIKTAKYNYIVNRLENYGKSQYVSNVDFEYRIFNTNVTTGENLLKLTKDVVNLKKRDCFKYLKHYIEMDSNGKVAIIYGLRRTGKTTLLFQMIRELPVNETAYIKIKSDDNMSLLVKDLEILNNSNYKYVFIDEITLMKDFINTAALLSDVFATMGLKIILSGTDSLGFQMANNDELYDRNYMIHTSFIPFREYSKLLSVNSIDTYIEYGGTLRIENISFDDKDAHNDEVGFRDDETTRKYIDTAISRNIQHTLSNTRFGEYFNQLRDLYDVGELTNAINRIVESVNHKFLLSIVQNEFKSHDLGSAKELLLHEYPKETAHILYEVNEKEIVKKLKELVDIKETSETKVTIKQEHVDKIKKYLYMLDLIVDCTERYETKGYGERIIFTQPGMRYAICKALIYSLMKDTYFNTCPESYKQHIKEKIIEDVKGRMMEDVVLLETKKTISKNEEVFKFIFDDGGEYDMVIYNSLTNSCCLFEVKHSSSVTIEQTRYLKDKTKLSKITYLFGKIEKRYVIYRGNTKLVDDIQYVNVEEYLIKTA